MTAKGLTQWIFPIVFVALILWWNWPSLSRPSVGTRQRAEFALLYTQSREMLDRFSKCAPSSRDFLFKEIVEQRVAVQKRFSALRKRVARSPFQDELKLVDMEQQIMAEDPKLGITGDGITCRRLAHLGSVNRVQVDQAIGRVETFLAAN